MEIRLLTIKPNDKVETWNGRKGHVIEVNDPYFTWTTTETTEHLKNLIGLTTTDFISNAKQYKRIGKHEFSISSTKKGR